MWTMYQALRPHQSRYCLLKSVFMTRLQNPSVLDRVQCCLALSYASIYSKVRWHVVRNSCQCLVAYDNIIFYWSVWSGSSLLIGLQRYLGGHLGNYVTMILISAHFRHSKIVWLVVSWRFPKELQTWNTYHFHLTKIMIETAVSRECLQHNMVSNFWNGWLAEVNWVRSGKILRVYLIFNFSIDRWSIWSSSLLQLYVFFFLIGCMFRLQFLTWEFSIVSRYVKKKGGNQGNLLTEHGII